MDTIKAKTRNLRRRQLDRLMMKLRPLKALSLPEKGWVKDIRESLGISITQMAKRLGTTRQGFQKLELGEQQQGITIRTLRRVAEALNCRLIYVLVPKEPYKGFEDILQQHAQRAAEIIVSRVSKTMALEDQEISKREMHQQIRELAEELKRNLDKRIWEDA